MFFSACFSLSLDLGCLSGSAWSPLQMRSVWVLCLTFWPLEHYNLQKWLNHSSCPNNWKRTSIILQTIKGCTMIYKEIVHLSLFFTCLHVMWDGSEECAGLGDDTRSRAHVGVPPHALADVCVTQANPIRSTSIFTSSLSQLKTVLSPPPVSLQISTSHRRNLLWVWPEPGCTWSFSSACGSLCDTSVYLSYCRMLQPAAGMLFPVCSLSDTSIQFVLFPCFLSPALLLLK